MIISTTALKNAIVNYNNVKRSKENYGIGSSAVAGMSAAFVTFSLVVAIIFFVLELLVLFYSISIAIGCTKGGPERVVHIVLAIIFTLPYALLNVLFNKCAKKVLRSDSVWLPNGSPVTKK